LLFLYYIVNFILYRIESNNIRNIQRTKSKTVEYVIRQEISDYIVQHVHRGASKRVSYKMRALSNIFVALKSIWTSTISLHHVRQPSLRGEFY